MDYERPPSRLSKIARDKYKKLYPELMIDSALKQELLAQYCEQFDLYLQATNAIKAAPAISVTLGKNGASQPIAEVKIQESALKQMRYLYALLNPSTKVSKICDKLEL